MRPVLTRTAHPRWPRFATAGRPGLALMLAMTLTAALLGLLPSTATAGQDSSLCKSDTTRLTIPGSYPLPACFDGSKLTIRNNTDFPLAITYDGDAGTPYQRPYGGLPELPSLVLTYIQPAEGNLLMPGYQLEFPIGSGTATTTLVGTDDNRTYVLLKALIGVVPMHELAEIAKNASAMTRELTDVWSQYQNCMDANGWFGQIGCEGLYYRNVAFAIGRFVGTSVAKPVIGAVLNLLDTALWANNAVSTIASLQAGQRTLNIAAALSAPAIPTTPITPSAPPASTPPTPAGPPLPTGLLSFAVTGTCSTDGGTLSSTSSNFTPGSTYTIQVTGPMGNYPLGNLASGTVRSGGNVVWNWPCQGDPVGGYTTTLTDQATGRTVSAGFTIAAPAPPPPPPPTLWDEQQGSRGANTFYDTNAASMGPRIDPYQWVKVSCKVYAPTIGSATPGGYWYRIASAPYYNAVYAVANTFWNGDIPGQQPYTHHFDPNVPDC